MELKIRIDTSQLKRRIRDIVSEQVPFAASRALNDTAVQVQKALQQEIATKFDRPTPIVQKAVRVTYANKRTLRAVVSFGGGQGIYARIDDFIRHEFSGGARRHKSMELLLDSLGLLSPGEYVAPAAGAKLDSYGNLSRAQAREIALQMKAQSGGLSMLYRPTKGTRKAGRRIGEYFFADGTRSAKGVWVRRTGRAIPVLLVIQPPRYKQAIDFEGVALRVSGVNLQRNFERRLAEALASKR